MFAEGEERNARLIWKKSDTTKLPMNTCMALLQRLAGVPFLSSHRITCSSAASQFSSINSLPEFHSSLRAETSCHTTTKNVAVALAELMDTCGQDVGADILDKCSRL